MDRQSQRKAQTQIEYREQPRAHAPDSLVLAGMTKGYEKVWVTGNFSPIESLVFERNQIEIH